MNIRFIARVRNRVAMWNWRRAVHLRNYVICGHRIAVGIGWAALWRGVYNNAVMCGKLAHRCTSELYC